MEIKEWLQKQSELDQFIIESKGLQSLDSKVRLTNTMLALIVEVSELANEVRTFKHWSAKPMSERDIILAEFSDCMHFVASIANQLGFTSEDIEKAYNAKYEVNIARQKGGY